MSDKNTRPELIAALVTDKYSGFKDGDEKLLEAASDARLEEFRASAEARKTEANAHARLETDQRNTTARLKVAEERLKAAEGELSEEDFLKRAPGGIKAVVEEHRAAEAAVKASLVSQLKDLGADTEEELKKKSIGELKTLASYARVSVPDFSGRGIATAPGSENSKANYAPPDPYKDGIKALQTATKH